jgi:hypothetical protein
MEINRCTVLLPVSADQLPPLYWTASKFITKFVPAPAKAGISIDEAIGFAPSI